MLRQNFHGHGSSTNTHLLWLDPSTARLFLEQVTRLPLLFQSTRTIAEASHFATAEM